MRESQRVVRSTKSITFALEAIPVIADVVANAVPGKLLWPVSRHLRETQHAHTFIIEGVRLSQVQDVELYGKIASGVSNSEEKPLCVAIRIDVILQNKIVLVITDFHRCQ